MTAKSVASVERNEASSNSREYNKNHENLRNKNCFIIYGNTNWKQNCFFAFIFSGIQKLTTAASACLFYLKCPVSTNYIWRRVCTAKYILLYLKTEYKTSYISIIATAITTYFLFHWLSLLGFTFKRLLFHFFVYIFIFF